MAILDIFNQDAFSMTTMGEAIDRTTHVPQGLAALNIFTQKPIRTASVAIEQRDGQLSLLSTSERGAPLTQRNNTKGVMKSYGTTRVGASDRILASELQFVRQFGTEDATAELSTEIARRLGGSGGVNSNGLIDDLRLTHENMRLGAIQGKVTDADGSIIMDWRSELGGTGSVKTTAFNLSSNDGSLKKQITKLKRDLIRNSKGVFQANSGIRAECGDEFYDALTQCPDVIKTYANAESRYHAAGGNEGQAFESFDFGGITWSNYRGTDDNSTVAIKGTECAIFPVRTPGLFLEVWSPGEKFEHIGQAGKEVYAELIPDLQRDSYVDLEVLSYPLHVCTNTQLLYTGTIK